MIFTTEFTASHSAVTPISEQRWQGDTGKQPEKRRTRPGERNGTPGASQQMKKPGGLVGGGRPPGGVFGG